MSKTLNELKEAASQWLSVDPDEETRLEIEHMLSTGDEGALRAAFGQRLEFGTAGIRGRLGPGPGQMNRVLVRRLAAGLAEYALGLSLDPVAVIGFDGRKNSRVFAEDSACVLASRGFSVFLYDEVVATPVLSHAVVELGASLGVMVTASHNPPQDNGYKVYWANGAQIVSPHDTGISSAMDSVSEVEVPDKEPLLENGCIRAVPEACLEAYYQAVLANRVRPVAGATAVYSAMHGVGGRFVSETLKRAGHLPLWVEPSQFEPDGSFPTVAFPNPEEEGAMDLALALALQEQTDLVLANDPDADRLAVLVRTPQGDYLPLTGNEVGLLLAERLLSQSAGLTRPMVATTIVSSTMLKKIAEFHGAIYKETLTGFKWIANKAIEHGKGDGAFVLGFEEALGYSIGPVVRDKDGVSALLHFMDLASEQKLAGRTVLDALEDLYRRYGFHLSEQVAIKLPGEAGRRKISDLLDRLRLSPPDSVGGAGVVKFVDFSGGVEDLPPSNVLSFHLEGGARILVRPSGTEPKIKFYFEVQEDIGEGSLEDWRVSASAISEQLKRDFLELSEL